MKRLASRFNPIVYLDVAIDGKPHGRVVLEVFETRLPVTGRNFRSIANGYSKKFVKHYSVEAGKHQTTELTLSYRNTKIHRIVPGFMIQGGDVLYNNGFGTTSIYDKTFFDEDFSIPHDRPGILSMANAGPNTNGSQFFITTAPAPHLNGKHVAFGQVVAGYDVVKEIEELGSEDGRPMAQVWITDSGELNQRGFMMEVEFERARLEERIAQEKAKDEEEIRIYNECMRSGIEYVPRALRERQLREIEAQQKVQEAEDFSQQMVREALQLDVEALSQKLRDLEKERSVRARASSSRGHLSKDVVTEIRNSKDGEAILSDSLRALADEPGHTTSSIEKFARALLNRAPSSFTSYQERIDNILEHSIRTPAPLTPEIIVDTVRRWRKLAEEQSGVYPDEQAQKDIDDLDMDYLAVLRIVERHPHVHSLSPQLTSDHVRVLDLLISELGVLKSMDTREQVLNAINAPSSGTRTDQIYSLGSKKSTLEDMMLPFVEAGVELPFDHFTSPFPTTTKSKRGKIQKQ